MSDSLLDLVRQSGFEASLFTTFNATLPFYEEVVLRHLVSRGCRYNVVLMDAVQCAQSWRADASRGRRSGHAYTLVPMHAQGSAFHPKVCLLLGRKRAVILVGSHNLTLAGRGNTEAVVLRMGDDARMAANAMNLPAGFVAEALTPSEIEAAIVRTRVELLKVQPAGLPVCMGIADLEEEAILVSLPMGRQFRPDVALRTSTGSEIAGVLATVVDGRDRISTAEDNLSDIRQARLHAADGGNDLLVLVHHPAVLGHLAQTQKHAVLRQALGNLDSDGADLGQLLAVIEKVIFAEDVHRDVAHLGGGRPGGAADQKDESRPDSLGVHVEAMGGQRNKKRRLLSSGDLAYLLDVLIRRLGLDLRATQGESGAKPVEPGDGTTDDSEPPPTLPVRDPNDKDLAVTVSRKAGILIRRMIRLLAEATKTPERTAGTITQLVAILGLLRKLRRLDTESRWHDCVDLVDREDRKKLLWAAMRALYGRNSMLLPKLLSEVDVEIEEVGYLRSLLLWLAWDVGAEITDRFSLSMEPEETARRVRRNAVLYELLPIVVRHDDEQAELERSLIMTAAGTAEAGARLTAWLTRHLAVGRALAIASSGPAPLGLRIGAPVRVPRSSPPRLRPIYELTSSNVTYWEFDGRPTFDRRIAAVD